MPYFLVWHCLVWHCWHSSATGVAHLYVWHWCAHTQLCHTCVICETGVQQVWHRCVLQPKKKSPKVIITRDMHMPYNMDDIFSFGTPVCAHQLHSSWAVAQQWHTCVDTAVTQVLLSGVTQVCGHNCATPVAQVWHTSVTFTCVKVTLLGHSSALFYYVRHLCGMDTGVESQTSVQHTSFMKLLCNRCGTWVFLRRKKHSKVLK